MMSYMAVTSLFGEKKKERLWMLTSVTLYLLIADR